jgi:toxin FitB
VLVDSNIVIYATKPEYAYVLAFLAQNPIEVSAISKIEVLGYHALSQSERTLLEQFFANATVLAVTESIIEQAIQLRQQRKMSLGDALIAATALCNQLKLVTRNVSDFAWIQGLDTVNPIR